MIIIGAGPAGVSAAMWCDEIGLDTLLLEQNEEIGGQLLWIFNPIRNYLGVQTESGRELRDIFAAQIEDADFDLWTNVEIESADLRAKRIGLRSGEQLQSIAIIIATGVRRRKLGIPGEAEFAGAGVVESAWRDREFLRGKDVCVIGGGEAAAENALMLAEICPTVTVVYREKQLSARREFRDRLISNHTITVFTEAHVKRILGSNCVEAVEVMRRDSLKPFQIAVQGVLIRIGVEPNSELFKDQLEIDSKGYLKVNCEQETSIENVFAVGDISAPLAPTISAATGAGAIAAKVVAGRINR